MAIGNNDIINIYNLFYLINLAVTVNDNIEGINKTKSNTSKFNFPNIYNWDFNVNIKQNYLRELEAAFNIFKDKYIKTKYLIKDN
jgi:hypothetical protein